MPPAPPCRPAPQLPKKPLLNLPADASSPNSPCTLLHLARPGGSRRHVSMADTCPGGRGGGGARGGKGVMGGEAAHSLWGPHGRATAHACRGTAVRRAGQVVARGHRGQRVGALAGGDPSCAPWAPHRVEDGRGLSLLLPEKLRGRAVGRGWGCRGEGESGVARWAHVCDRRHAQHQLQPQPQGAVGARLAGGNSALCTAPCSRTCPPDGPRSSARGGGVCRVGGGEEQARAQQRWRGRVCAPRAAAAARSCQSASPFKTPQ